jgi:hypothetical protein
MFLDGMPRRVSGDLTVWRQVTKCGQARVDSVTGANSAPGRFRDKPGQREPGTLVWGAPGRSMPKTLVDPGVDD